MQYRERIVDSILQRQLKASGAVLVRGVKGSGKTETAKQHAKSEIVIDNSPSVETAMQSDPRLLLKGEAPRLIDEWQEQPRLWNAVRHEVDARQEKGQFILTGSANPEEQASLHSGVGRFGVIRMHTMTWYERGWSSGDVRLTDILADKPIAAESELNVEQLAERLVIGGWPGHLGMEEEDAILSMQNYFDLLCEIDLSRVSNMRRDPIRIRRVLRSIARNIATECAVTTIAADAGGVETPLAHETVDDYLDALNRLMIVDDLPGWKPQIRTRARLRSTPRRHFADPSLAISALDLNAQRLLGDLNYTGFVFESQAIHDLRVYAQSLGAQLGYYRDSNGVEADAILEQRNGSWAAFEIKLGMGAVNQAAASLLKLKSTIDTAASGEPLALVVITGQGIAHKRKDGVYVVPLQALKP